MSKPLSQSALREKLALEVLKMQGMVDELRAVALSSMDLRTTAHMDDVDGLCKDLGASASRVAKMYKATMEDSGR